MFAAGVHSCMLSFSPLYFVCLWVCVITPGFVPPLGTVVYCVGS